MKPGTWAIATVLLVGSAGAVGAGEYFSLGTALSCEVYVPFLTVARSDSICPVVLLFNNDHDPRTVRVVAGGARKVSTVFSMPTGAAIKRCIYVPAWQNDLSVSFFDGATGSLLASRNVYPGGVRTVGRREPTPRGAPQLLGISLSSAAPIAVNERLDPVFKLRIDSAPVGLTPDSWVGYSGLDVVVIDHRVWLSAAFDRQPLIDWMAMGGVCLFADVAPDEQAEIQKLVSARAPFVSERSGSEPYFSVGSGGAAFVERKLLAGSHSGFFGARGLLAALKARISHAAAAKPRIDGIGAPPFWASLGALVLFAGAVGPFGWWWLVRRKKALLLYYVAAPAASLCVMAVIIVLAFLQEGFRPYVSGVAVRFVDQRVSRSIDAAQFSVYAPVTFGADLEGSAHELAYFIATDSFASEDASEDGTELRPEMALKDGRCHYGNVPPARTVCWLGREELRTERRRLVVTEKNGVITVENHLGSDLHDLLVGHRGSFARFERLPAGARQSSGLVHPNDVTATWTARRTELAKLFEGTVLGMNGRAAEGWLQAAYRTGNFYVGQCPGIVREQVWVRSYRDEGAEGMIVGVY